MLKAETSNTTSLIIRYEQVFAILIKYGFEDILSHPPLNKITPQTNILVPSRNGQKVSKFTRVERIRMVCEELGTTFIKFAQIASNRPDLLQEDLIFELEKLQDQAPIVSTDKIKEILENELPRPLEEFVDFFDETPLASASMSQVHRATLKGGKEVVLKVQRPNLKKIIEADLLILKNIVSIVNTYFPKYKHYNLHELVKMFENSIMEELDFKLEARNLQHFQKMFLHNDEVFVPKHYEELSTSKVLCLEYVDGYKITDLENLKAFNITGKELALKGIGLYFEQVFEHGFFHADPHPGNIFALENGKIAFIDYGMMGTVSEADKNLFAKLLLSIHEKDVESMKKTVLQFTSGLSKEKQIELEYDIIYFFRNYSDLAIENIDGNEVMRGLNSLFYDYKIKIPSNLLLLIKALVILEGVGLKLDPEYDIIKNIGPFVKKLLAKSYNPLQIQKDLVNTLNDLSTLSKELPNDVKEIVHKIKEGKLHIEFEHKGLETMRHSFDVIANRMSFTLIIVAMTLASSILVLADVTPKTYNIPTLSLIGFAIAVFLGIRLLYAIFKTGKI